MEISVRGLRKEIGEKEIFSGVSFTLKKGEALALRGVNGSGKTTLLRILSGLDKAYYGEVHFSKKGRIGYVAQDIVLFEELTVYDNLSIFAKESLNSQGMRQKIESFSSRFELSSLMKKKVKYLSGGQKRLVHILVSLIGEPDFIFLDEVIVGLDEDKMRLLSNYLLSIREEKIMILTSHQDDFLREVCNLSAEIIKGEWKIKNEME